jgi:AraC-like DNA-binding protein
MGGGTKFLAVLNLLGVAQGLLLALALVTLRRGSATANRLLAAFVATISVLVCGAVLFTTGYVLAYPHLSRAHHPFLFLAAPLFYLYVRELTAGGRFARRDWLHFLPFALCALYLAPHYAASAADKLTSLTSPDYQRWYDVRHALAYAQGAVYLFFTVTAARRHARQIGGQPSPAEQAARLQIQVLMAALTVIFAGGVLRYLLRDRSVETNLLLPLCASALVYTVAYLGLRRPEVLAGREESQPAPRPRKYERSTLTPERAEESLRRLVQVMESEKLYADGGLTLQKLAARLALTPQHLSQLINERLGQSFPDFVNSYRVAEARRKLTDPACRHYSILAVAEEVGFNSKSTFNAAFKKHTGLTPSEFREQSKLLESA